MSELMTKQEIAKELLKPYFDDPNLCSVDLEGTGVYKGLGGRMCVFARACTSEGRELIRERHYACKLLTIHGTGILQDKYRHIGDIRFWSRLQYTHDTLAEGRTDAAKVNYRALTGESHNAG